MQVVIEIDERYYEIIKNDVEHGCDFKPFKIIADGTPLPKGHGRLIDGEKIANAIDALKDNWNRYGNEYESGRYESYDYAVDTIQGAPTIIEADKESEVEG